ncbi:hypothetical protein ACJIZ3_010035 [Penstemon smallii]|uniref:Rhodanese domain-containing protein n=1 Tax=Penstemon smallii TaxID=265156 RepID=A0ABD3TE66_9LAMI
MASSSYAVISYPSPFSRPKCSTATINNFITPPIQEVSTFKNKTKLITFPAFGSDKFSWNYGQSSKLSAFSARNGNWVDVEAGSPKEYKDDEFMVVNFYRFVFIENPEEEVSRHLSFMQIDEKVATLFYCHLEKKFQNGNGRDIHGRIYLNEQGINAQYSGPSKDALAYVEWVKADQRFLDILVQITPALNGHAFPKLKLRYKPSLVQLEEGISHLPLLDPSMRATPLTPSQWRSKIKAVNKTENASSAVDTNCILLDVRNGTIYPSVNPCFLHPSTRFNVSRSLGYEWDVGHFQGAQRPDVDCFRSTSFGLSESEASPPSIILLILPYISLVVASDPLANVDKEKTDILMYCTGGIRCDVYSTILRQKGFKRLYTLKGGVSHYLENEGSDGWVGNLFVFDGRLSLPPSTYKPEINGAEEQVSHSFAKCYICASQVSELRHRNCANLDCNLLFLCCVKCVNDFRGCCCINCTSAPRLRPLLIGHQRYQKWHKYRDVELQI